MARATPKEETWTGAMLSVLGYTLIVSFIVLLALVIAGQFYPPILARLGLGTWYTKKGGAYIDCNDPSNRDNRYCTPDETEEESFFRDIKRGGGPPFSLTER